MESITTIIISVLTAVGGWEAIRYIINRRAEKRKADAEADSAEMGTVKNMQDVYDKMFEQVNRHIEDAAGKVDEMRAERDQYKKERDAIRDRFEKMEETLHNMRTEYQTEKNDTDRKIAQLGRKVEAMRPFMCGILGCKRRKPVTISADGEIEREQVDDIDPIDNSVL